ncbi:MAG: hypothetical protein K2K07_14275 [Lachnospiraceae bacterium]|nr:hypothetical protein [Lachnospiraceae bacterium]
MGIGSVTSTNSMSGIQTNMAASTDPKIKNIQNEITDAKQQMQKLSSKEDLSVNEKSDERKKLQKEISDLNTELKQHQEELSRSQKREIMLAELQEDQKPTKEETSEDKVQAAESSSDQEDEKKLPLDGQQSESQGTVVARNSDGVVILTEAMKPNENRSVDAEEAQVEETKVEDTAETEAKPTAGDTATDTGLSHKDMRAMVSADSTVQQANRQGAIVARTRDGIAILKGEIKLDELRGADTEKKQAELEKMEQREERATTFQFSVLGEANNAMKSDAGNVSGTTNAAQANADNNAYLNAMKISQENEQAAQQRFYVSFS